MNKPNFSLIIVGCFLATWGGWKWENTLYQPTPNLPTPVLTSCVVQVVIPSDHDVEVTVPCMKKEDLQKILVTFLAKGNQTSQARLQQVLGESHDLTMTLTTKQK